MIFPQEEKNNLSDQMGCLSSKFITKTFSFREDISQRKRGANSLLMLDELFTSDDGSDHQFFALVGKLQTGDFVLPPKKSVESRNEEIINTWELMAGLEEQVEQKQDVVPQEFTSWDVVDIDKLKRSKSCEMSTLFSSFEGINEDQRNKGVGRCRSFHTVEEYDAMMERILLQNNDYNQITANSAQSCQYLNKNVSEFQEKVELFSGNEFLNTKPFTSEPDIKEVIPNLSSSSINKHDVVQERSISDTGFKRKALARGLGSLKIPSAVEFQKTGSLRDWLKNGGSVSSPGENATPKFGNYNKPNSALSEEYRDDPVFNPELVAAFEELLQQLEVEEDCILKQVEGNHDEITVNEQSGQEILTNL